MEPEHEENHLPMSCRPTQSGWLVVIFFIAIGLVCTYAGHLPPHRPGDALLFGLMASLFLVPALLGAVWLLRAQVAVDDAGLRWRMLGLWHHPKWEEVTDYYEALVPGKPGKPRLVVETRCGRLSLSQDAWGKGIEALRQPIAQRAMQAEARAWEVQGTRQQDQWPRIFRYDTPGNRYTQWLVMGLSMAGVVALVSDQWQVLLHDPGRVWEAAALGVFLLLMAVHVWLVLGLSGLAGARRSQRITASLEGLAYAEGGEARQQAAWADVTAYGTIPLTQLGITIRGYRVITRSGSFDFSAAITDVFLLREIIRRYATNAAGSEWKVPPGDTLGGIAARWSSGRESVGARVYHYRTRTNRAMLWLPTALALVLALLAPLAAYGLAPITIWYGVAALWAFTLLGWWRYCIASVQVDSDGITQYAVFGPRRLRWDQVEKFYMSGEDTFQFGNVVGAGTRIRFWIGIADVDELKDEIAGRAIHSKTRTWDDKQRSRETSATKTTSW